MRSIFLGFIICVALCPLANSDEATILMPEIDGDWWQVAGNPDLGDYTRPGQQPVDFGVWQAADGTWQLWSCIRGTRCGKHTRLLYAWEGENLTATDWQPQGIAMEAKPELGEADGGMQAPHVVKTDGKYVMAYGAWDFIGFADSTNGKTFKRRIGSDGTSRVFGEVRGANPRDAMLLFTNNQWLCYYTAHPGYHGYDFCRYAPDLDSPWSDSFVVAYGGQAGNNPYSAECPHVVEPRPGLYYLFRTQRYGKGAQTSVYWSNNPYHFGIDNDWTFVCTMPVAAPEIVLHNGQYYMAALNNDLQGIRIARMKWVETPPLGVPVFNFDNHDHRQQWKVVNGHFANVFTTSDRVHFGSPTQHFIGTAEADGKIVDTQSGIIRSPVFHVRSTHYKALMSGGGNPDELYIALYDAKTDEELLRIGQPETSNRMAAFPVDCSAFAGKHVYLQVVDQSSTPWGHLNFGGLFEVH